MNRLTRRYAFPLLMLFLSGTASAIGLGELRGQPTLGERIRLEINLLGAEKLHLDAACFRLVQPAGAGSLPWLKKASLSVRKGNPPVLEIRSEAPLREPLLQVAVQLGCGHEVSREYMLMASPVADVASAPGVERRLPGDSGVPVAEAISPMPSMVQRQPAKARPAVPADAEALSRQFPKRPEKKSTVAGLPDRLVLSDGADVGEPSLRLATALVPGRGEARDAQREILRLEYRMLMAMNEQAISQMAAAEKLRNMEGTLGELQLRAGDFALRVEKNAVTPEAREPGVIGQPTVQPDPVPAAGGVPVKPISKPLPATEMERETSAWVFYGALLGAALGLAGWLGWRNYRERKTQVAKIATPISVPDVKVDQPRAEELEEFGGVDLPFEPATMGVPMQVDVELDTGGDSKTSRAVVPEKEQAWRADSMMPISATTLDENLEANPVMELADIMLSFGRVKGAAQALQEFIDNNPQEALQPWIRLMDVYRMAGMRTEFENVARNLNQHFNVEVQSWDASQASMEVRYSGSEAAVAPRPQSLEDMPRLMNMIVELWEAGDVVGYLYQLLRDNRGGQRQGFALTVVEDILFLVELKETAKRMDGV